MCARNSRHVNAVKRRSLGPANPIPKRNGFVLPSLRGRPPRNSAEEAKSLD